jgi:hypothetical protein
VIARQLIITMAMGSTVLVGQQSSTVPNSASLAFWVHDGATHADWYRQGATWLERRLSGMTTTFTEVQRVDPAPPESGIVVRDSPGNLVLLPCIRPFDTSAPSSCANSRMYTRAAGQSAWNRADVEIRPARMGRDRLSSVPTAPEADTRFFAMVAVNGGRDEWFSDGALWNVRTHDGHVHEYLPLRPVVFDGDRDVPTFGGFANPGNRTSYGLVLGPLDPADDTVFLPWMTSPDRTFKTKGPSNNATWSAKGQTTRVSAGGTIPVDVSFNLQSAVNAALMAVPRHFDERGDPLSNRFRWAFDLVDAQPSLVNGRVHLDITYKGDVETKFFPGCHLRWVYPIARIGFIPRLARQQDGKWAVQPDDLQYEVVLAPNSDTGCGLLGVLDIREVLLDVLNGDAVTTKLISGVSGAAMPVSLETLWANLSGPIDLGTTGDGKTCLYVDLDSIEVGALSGTIRQAHAKVRLITRSAAFVQDRCVQPAPPLQPSVRAATADTRSFSTAVGVLIRYEQISSMLQGSVPGTEGSLENLHVHGVLDSMIIAAHSLNPIDVAMEFSAVPRFTDGGRRLVISVSPTSELLTGLTSSTARDFVTAIANALTAAGPVDLTSSINDAQSKIAGDHKINISSSPSSTALAAQSATLTITAPTLTPLAVIPASDGLHVYFQIEGTAAIRVQ